MRRRSAIARGPRFDFFFFVALVSPFFLFLRIVRAGAFSSLFRAVWTLANTKRREKRAARILCSRPRDAVMKLVPFRGTTPRLSVFYPVFRFIPWKSWRTWFLTKEFFCWIVTYILIVTIYKVIWNFIGRTSWILILNEARFDLC